MKKTSVHSIITVVLKCYTTTEMPSVAASHKACFPHHFPFSSVTLGHLLLWSRTEVNGEPFSGHSSGAPFRLPLFLQESLGLGFDGQDGGCLG